MIQGFGLVKTSLIDYPGRVAAVLFTPGCNFRCPYCHNPELVSGTVPEDFIDWEEALTFLEKRRGLLGGVVLTGGEPLVHTDLAQKIEVIHSLGMSVKIDTNGSFPEALIDAAPDFVAMDIKTAFSRYSRVLPAGGDADAAANALQRSLELMRKAGVPFQLRTTMVPGIVNEEDFDEILPHVSGADSYLLSGFRAARTLNPEFSDILPYEAPVLERIKTRIEDAGVQASIRLNA